MNDAVTSVARRIVRATVPHPWRHRLWLGWRAVFAVLHRQVATAVTAYRIRRRGARTGGLARLDALVVINLASRTDRLAGFSAEMQRLRADFVRFDAEAHRKGIIGCTRSHAACVRMMLDRGWRAMMVCEDDARFLVDRPELDMLVDAFLDDPLAEVACLAYNLHVAEWYSPLFLRAIRSRTTASYVLKASIATDLLRIWENGIEQMEEGGDRNQFGIDTAWFPIQQERIFVIPVRRAAVQAAGYSDVEGTLVDYGV